MLTKKAKEISKALPLSEILRDLALLRTSDVDLSKLVPSTSDEEANKADKGSLAVAESAEFIAETRKAIRLHSREDVDVAGRTVDQVRKKYEELLEGLA